MWRSGQQCPYSIGTTSRKNDEAGGSRTTKKRDLIPILPHKSPCPHRECTESAISSRSLGVFATSPAPHLGQKRDFIPTRIFSSQKSYAILFNYIKYTDAFFPLETPRGCGLSRGKRPRAEPLATRKNASQAALPGSGRRRAKSGSDRGRSGRELGTSGQQRAKSGQQRGMTAKIFCISP